VRNVTSVIIYGFTSVQFKITLFVSIRKIFRDINTCRLRTIKNSNHSEAYVHVTRKTRNISFLNHLILSGGTFLTTVPKYPKKHWFLNFARLRPLVLPYEQRADEDCCEVTKTEENRLAN